MIEKAGMDQAVGVVASLYRREFSSRFGPDYYPTPLADRTEMWKKIASFHQPQLAFRMNILRHFLTNAHQSAEPVRLAGLFPDYFNQEALRLTRHLERLGVGFWVHPGIGVRELFLADILTNRVPSNLTALQYHEAKSILLSELLGEPKPLDFIPVTFKDFKDKSKPGNEASKLAAEIERQASLLGRVGSLTFRDIIQATLESKIKFTTIKPDELKLVTKHKLLP